ncbi:MAG TPA: PA14 domain-containing protein [Bryobacteraceae bacterium]|nr:PA14 domain-containing protein [Bryobacteraceae bacterium]
MFSPRQFSAPILLAMLASALVAQDAPYRFSTTVYGEPIYTFGTTVADNSGFRGEIYHIAPGRSKLPDFSKLNPVGVIYTPYLCVPPRAFDQGFPGVTDRFEWFAIDYSGRFWISEPGAYRFSLASDDGSILYIDGKRIIHNDGTHPVIEKRGSVKLKAGAHRIRVSYFQGPRYHVALVLQVAGPGAGELRVFHTGDFKPPPDTR